MLRLIRITLTSWFEIFREDHIVVVLLNVVLQIVMSSEECSKFVTRPIICKLFWSHTFLLKHVFKDLLALTTTLDTFMNIEV